MKQEDVNKLFALFMVFIMVVSAIAYFIGSPRSESREVQQTQSQENKYNPEFWTISEPFLSISDSLNMTPYGIETAYFTDLDSMTPQMIQLVRQDLPVLNDVDFLYKSNTTKMYFGLLKEGQNESFLLLSTMSPEKNVFDYIVAPNQYGYHYILIRQDTGAINVMGNPVIYAPQKTAVDVLNIILSMNRTITAYDQYEGLMDKVEPVPYQIINSNITFADQFYRGIREINGTYERTTAYLNINSSSLEKLQQRKVNSTENGFAVYNITRDGNYTIVKIITEKPDLFKIWFEDIN